MRFKTVMAVLVLLVLIFYTIQSSHGALGNGNNIHDLLAPPNEHPWQDSGSPQVKDTVQVDMVCPIPVVIGPLEIIMIKPVIKVKLGPSNSQTADDRSYGRTPR
jgi:hypothetical protein